jgi:chromosome segregation ATPase
MIEPIMFIGIGFLLASLLVIGAIPMVHARAVRLTQRRLEALTPISMAEIHADKDQLRAEFAMSTRRLEMSVDQMKAKTSSQLAEIGKKSEAVGRLKLELGEKAAELLGVEAKLNSVTEELDSVKFELSEKNNVLQRTERALAESASELGKSASELSARVVKVDSQTIELATLQAQSQVLKSQIESYEQEVRSLQSRLDAQTSTASTTSAALTEERIKTETYTARIREFEKQLVVQTTESEISGRRVQELLGRLDGHERDAAEHQASSELLRSKLAIAAEIETGIRAELSTREKEYRAATEALSATKAKIEEQLNLVTGERDRVQHQVATLKQEAEQARLTERLETAVMRERITDVAAEVARLTAALEGPSSPIEAILAEGGHATTAAPTVAVNENGAGEKVNGAMAANGRASLADRIRALQSRHERVAQTG